MYSLAIQKELDPKGRGSIYPIDDMLYIEGSGWLLASPFPAPLLVRPAIQPTLRAFFEANPRTPADLRVLTSQTFATAGRAVRDWADKERAIFDFIPEDGTQAVSMCGPFTDWQGRRRIEDAVPSLFGPNRTDLTALWEQGKVQPIYDQNTRAAAYARASIVNRQAWMYRFRFVDPGTGLTRVVQVAGGVWRAMHELGLRATVANARYNEALPVIGVSHAQDPSSLFGYIVQETPGPSMPTDDGRDLVYSGHSCSWAYDHELFAWLVKTDKLETSAPPATSLADVLNGTSKYAKEVRATVDVLRWRGVPDSEIDVWLHQNLPPAYYEMAVKITAAALASIERVDQNRDQVTGAIGRWDSQHVRNTLKQLRKWCTWLPYQEARDVIEAVLPQTEAMVENDLEPFMED